MRFPNLVLLPAFALIFLGGGLIPHACSHAEEPAEQFLKALINERFYDVAEGYLEQAQDSDLVPNDFRAKIPYERAKILVRSAVSERDQKVSEDKFNLADQLLNTYADTLSTSVEKFNVLLESANIKIKRSEIQINRSKNKRVPDEEKSAMLQKADSLLRSALSQYDSGQTELRDVLKGYVVDPQQPKSAAEKQQLRQQYLSIRTQQPLVTERLADTLPDDSPERKALLEKAVKQSEDVYDTYRRVKKQAFIFKAAINGARAAQKLGDHKKTLQLLAYVFDIGNGAAEDRLKKDAAMVAVNSWDKVEPYPAQEIIKLLDDRIARLNRSQTNQPDWQRIQLELATAKLARTGGPHRPLAKSIVDKWELSFAETDTEKAVAAVKTFEDAKAVAKELTPSVLELQNEVRKQKSLLARTKAPAERAALAEQLEESSARLTEKAGAALDFYQTALAMTDCDITSRPVILPKANRCSRH